MASILFFAFPTRLGLFSKKIPRGDFWPTFDKKRAVRGDLSDLKRKDG